MVINLKHIFIYAAAGCCAGFMCGATYVAVQQGKRLDYQQAELAQLSGRVSALERAVRTRDKRVFHLSEQLEELQGWRIHITAASRMGWAPAVRYIREFPLEMPPLRGEGE